MLEWEYDRLTQKYGHSTECEWNKSHRILKNISYGNDHIKLSMFRFRVEA